MGVVLPVSLYMSHKHTENIVNT